PLRPRTQGLRHHWISSGLSQSFWHRCAPHSRRLRLKSPASAATDRNGIPQKVHCVAPEIPPDAVPLPASSPPRYPPRCNSVSIHCVVASSSASCALRRALACRCRCDPYNTAPTATPAHRDCVLRPTAVQPV